jgi:ribosome-associated translation inhibitor RaiA
MDIQLNTDDKISVNEELRDMFTGMISEELKRFGDQVTRLEVHLSDEDGRKTGVNDKRCLIEARLEGIQPIAVTERADTIEQAVSGAIDKLKAALETRIGRLRNH